MKRRGGELTDEAKRAKKELAAKKRVERKAKKLEEAKELEESIKKWKLDLVAKNDKSVEWDLSGKHAWRFRCGFAIVHPYEVPDPEDLDHRFYDLSRKIQIVCKDDGCAIITRWYRNPGFCWFSVVNETHFQIHSVTATTTVLMCSQVCQWYNYYPIQHTGKHVSSDGIMSKLKRFITIEHPDIRHVCSEPCYEEHRECAAEEPYRTEGERRRNWPAGWGVLVANYKKMRMVYLNRRYAFLMGCHERLGRKSCVGSVPKTVLEQIISFI